MIHDTKNKMHFAYKSVNDLFSSYRTNMSISCIRYRDNSYYDIVQSDYKRKLGGIQIDMDRVKKIVTLSMGCHSVRLDLNTKDLSLIYIEEDNIVEFILLLPELVSIGFIRSLRNESYYSIDSEWNELDDHMD